ncbi:hypothetical protein RFEPED_1067 [Rickettsia felis str. Pedreira]|uniref:Uncharacterized protein n=1 Tax=Rickettsia felis str. Pedreira TaxID=1359196 RepID=A0A0F3MSP4_RICFI|nr:hypothetical protein [Rickettsia felis]KJV58676.1 hypothetical protein RFEPED_1067 [Rickettsia felis str. Pedreira]
MRGNYKVINEAISGVLFHEIATQPTAARNDEIRHNTYLFT